MRIDSDLNDIGGDHFFFFLCLRFFWLKFAFSMNSASLSICSSPVSVLGSVGGFSIFSSNVLEVIVVVSEVYSFVS